VLLKDVSKQKNVHTANFMLLIFLYLMYQLTIALNEKIQTIKHNSR